MALTLWGKPGAIPFLDGIAISYSAHAKGRGRSFEHPTSFTVDLVPASDRKVTVGALPAGSPYATMSRLNRVGEDGLLVTMDTTEEAQFDVAVTSPRWDVLGIQVNNADTSGGTATLRIVKGTEGNAAGGITWPVNTQTSRFWAVQDIQVNPGQSAVTKGRRYLTFTARTTQVLDKTPPDNTGIPAGSAFIDSAAGSIRLRTWDVNNQLVTTDVSPVGSRLRTPPNPSLTISPVSLPIPGPSAGSFDVAWDLTKPSGVAVATGSHYSYQTPSGKVYSLIVTGSTGFVNMYDPTTGTSTPIMDITAVGNGQGRIVVNDSETRIVFAADIGLQATCTFYLIDLVTRTTTTLTKPGTLVYQGSIATIGGDFYFIGGKNASNATIYEHWKLIAGNTTFTACTNVPNSVADGMVFPRSMSGKYIFSQYSGNAFSVYDPVANSWATLTPTGGVGNLNATTAVFYDPSGVGLLFSGNGTNAPIYRLLNLTGTTQGVGTSDTAGTVQQTDILRADTARYMSPILLPNGWAFATSSTGLTGTNAAARMRPWRDFPVAEVTASGAGTAEPLGKTGYVRNVTRNTGWVQSRVVADAGDVIQFWDNPLAPHPVGTAFRCKTLEMGGIPQS